MFNKMLVAIDDSDIYQPVFDKGVLLAKSTAANLMLLNVVSPFDQQYPYPTFICPSTIVPAVHVEAVEQYMEQWEKFKQDRNLFLSQLCQQAIELSINAEFKLLFGDPGQIICETARNWNADLIIIGRRGRTGLSELFLGSVSNYVLHHAPCSVLTVQQLIKLNAEEPQQVQKTSI